MKKHEDYLATSLWYREEITDPYQVIASFFDYIDISSCRKKIKHLLLAAGSDEIYRYRKDSPASVLELFKMIESVINAAYLINKEKKESPLSIGTGDLLNKNLFCGNKGHASAWDYFPRSLSEKEFIDPYLTFRHFFKFKEIEGWKEDLQEVLSFALSAGSYSDLGIELNLLSIYIHLTKLLEAAHLIDVRETTHIDGRIKNRLAS
jgi:hypothetical protein